MRDTRIRIMIRTFVRAVSTSAPRPVFLPQTILDPSRGLYLGWDLDSFQRALALKALERDNFKARIVGYTTPALRDVGGASIRLQIENDFELKSGGYLLMLRNNNVLSNFPALAGVPGNAPDRAGIARNGLAECIVMGKPARSDKDPSIQCTFFPQPLLELLYPVGGVLDVAAVHRATDFFLGLNAGQWLKIRIAQISDAARAHLASGIATTGASTGAGRPALDRALRKAGFAPGPPGAAEPPPPDAAHLFHFYGNFSVTPDSLGR